MAYFNNTNNADFYSTSSGSGEFDGYPFLGQTPTTTTEEANGQTHGIYADYWSTASQPGLAVDSSTSPPTTASYESLDSTTSYAALMSRYAQPPCPGPYWPVVGQQSQDYNPDSSNQGGYFANMMASETSTATSVPSSAPLSYWGANQSGPYTSTFYVENVHSSYQPSTGPTRTGLMSTGRFQPYGMFHTHSNEYWNAEADPSALVAPPATYVDPSVPQPSGGISETTADAETNQTLTEEDEVPMPKRTRLPRGEGRPRIHRTREQKDSRKLRDWVRRRDGLHKSPSVNEALAVAVKIIPTIRPVVYQRPCLVVTPGKLNPARSKRAKEEYERRKVERGLYQELSRYYPLEGRPKWGRQDLLVRVRQDLEGLPPLPGPSNNPPP